MTKTRKNYYLITKAFDKREWKQQLYQDELKSRAQLREKAKEELANFTLEDIVYFLSYDIMKMKEVLFRFQNNYSQAETEFQEVLKERDLYRDKLQSLDALWERVKENVPEVREYLQRTSGKGLNK